MNERGEEVQDFIESLNKGWLEIRSLFELRTDLNNLK